MYFQAIRHVKRKHPNKSCAWLVERNFSKAEVKKKKKDVRPALSPSPKVIGHSGKEAMSEVNLEPRALKTMNQSRTERILFPQ